MQTPSIDIRGLTSYIAKDPSRFARKALFQILTVAILWKYITLFMGMSYDMSKQISLNIVIAGNSSQTYYPLGDQVLVVGGICLVFFALRLSQTKHGRREYGLARPGDFAHLRLRQDFAHLRTTLMHVRTHCMPCHRRVRLRL